MLLADRACRRLDDLGTSLTALAVEIEPAVPKTAWQVLVAIGWVLPPDETRNE